MSPLRCFQIFILLLIDGFRQIKLVQCDSNPLCPRNLYDCNSLEGELHSSIDVILSPNFMLHVHDYHSIADMCSFFQTPSCSDPVLKKCKGEVVYSSRAFKSRQQNICGDTLAEKDKEHFKRCSREHHRLFRRCLEKKADKLEEVTYMAHPSGTDHPWCNITNDYISCIYSIMALGCAIDLAENYMRIVNQSLPVLEAVFGYGCSFGHPLDVLKTTTPLMETTSSSINRVAGVYSYERRPTRPSNGSIYISVNIAFNLFCILISIVNANVNMDVNVLDTNIRL